MRVYRGIIPSVAANYSFLVYIFFDQSSNLQNILATYLLFHLLSHFVIFSMVFRQWAQNQQKTVIRKKPDIKEVISQSSVSSLISFGNIIFRLSALALISEFQDPATVVILSLCLQILTFVMPFMNFTTTIVSSFFSVSSHLESSKGELYKFRSLWLFSIDVCVFAVFSIMLMLPVFLPVWLEGTLSEIQLQRMESLLSVALLSAIFLNSANLFRNFLLAQNFIKHVSFTDFAIQCFLALRSTFLTSPHFYLL